MVYLQWLSHEQRNSEVGNGHIFCPMEKICPTRERRRMLTNFFKRRREETWSHFPDGGGHAGPKILLWLYPAGHLGHR